METGGWLQGLIEQAPNVGLVLYLMHKFKDWGDAQRAEFLAYLRERDAATKENFSAMANAQGDLSREIHGLAVALAKSQVKGGRV